MESDADRLRELRELKLMLERVDRVLASANLSFASISYIIWLIPLSLTVLLYSLKPFLALEYTIRSIITTGIWLSMIPLIKWSLGIWSQRMSYLFARYYGRAPKMTKFDKIVYMGSWVIGFAVIWPATSILLGLAGFDSETSRSIGLLLALICGVASLTLAEKIKYKMKFPYSAIALALLVIGVIANLARLSDYPFLLASMFIILGYTGAALAYLISAFKLLVEV